MLMSANVKSLASFSDSPTRKYDPEESQQQCAI